METQYTKFQYTVFETIGHRCKCVLYQPKLFTTSTYDLKGIEKTKCIGDDIWLKAAQMVSGLNVVSTE